MQTAAAASAEDSARVRGRFRTSRYIIPSPAHSQAIVIAGRRSGAFEVLQPTRTIRAITAPSAHDHRSRVFPASKNEATPIAVTPTMIVAQTRPEPVSASSDGQ